jgi:hypothetical protein
MEADRIINGNCWVAYFDILGFKNEIRLQTGHLDVFAKIQYEEILRHIEEEKKTVRGFTPKEHDCCWFSDSFLFYALDDSINSYLTMHYVATEFFHHLGVMKRWPVTGALTFGEFYADKDKSIYLGEALIDAHKYTDEQNWIGIVLTPSAHERLVEKSKTEGLNLFSYVNGLGFKEYDVPIKRKKCVDGRDHIESGREKLFAHQYRADDGSRSLFLDYIESMSNKKEGQETAYRQKYENTLRFYKEIG